MPLLWPIWGLALHKDVHGSLADVVAKEP